MHIPGLSKKSSKEKTSEKPPSPPSSTNGAAIPSANGNGASNGNGVSSSNTVVVPDPIITYNLKQSLSGKISVLPSPPSNHSFSLVLTKPKAKKDTLEVTAHRSGGTNPNDNDTVGRCVIQVVLGKFLECKLGDGSEVKLENHGIGQWQTYSLSTPKHPGLKWEHDAKAGGRTSGDRKLKLEDKDKNVVARFAGADSGVDQFGIMEIYDKECANDPEWCGLVVLTAVCVYAREERNREKGKKVNDAAGFVGTWGGLLTMGVPMG